MNVQVDWKALMGEDHEEVKSKTTPGNITQHTLISYLIANAEVWTIIEPIINPDYFINEYRNVIKFIIEYVNEYKILPRIETINFKTSILLDKYDEFDVREQEWLIHEIEEFCRHSATVREIKRAYDVITKDKSRESLEEIFQNIKNITEISINKNLGIEIHRDAKEILERKDSVIWESSGYQHIDLVLNGGFPRPGMVLVAGPSGQGKSVNLSNFGINFCEKGEFVVYITLEMSEDRVFNRISGMMADVAVKQIKKEKDKITKTMEYRINNGDGLFIIKKMSGSGTTASHINAYLKEVYIKEGKKPTVLIVDYIDCMHPKTNVDNGNIHIRDKFIIEELYDVVSEWNLIGLTASQKVKNNSDMDMFDHASLAGGTPKINTVDIAMAFQRKDEIVWFYVIKGRDGGFGASIPLITNIDTLRLSDAPDETFYEKNQWYNPNRNRTENEKLANQQKKAINKDMRSFIKDDIMEKIKNSNNDLFANPDYDPFTGEILE